MTKTRWWTTTTTRSRRTTRRSESGVGRPCLLYVSSSSAVEAKRSSSSSASIIGDELSLLSSSSFFKSRPNYYAKRPPHDTKLYDILGIAPNATVLDVQKAHRKRSLLYHPDKIPPSQAIEAKLKLDKISHASAGAKSSRFIIEFHAQHKRDTGNQKKNDTMYLYLSIHNCRCSSRDSGSRLIPKNECIRQVRVKSNNGQSECHVP